MKQNGACSISSWSSVERGWIKARGQQRTDSTHVLAAVRTLRQLECVGETMRHALNVLAEVAPEWLLSHMDPAWAERYEKRFSDFRLPKDEKKRTELAETIERMGADCSSRSAPKAACPGCGNWTPSKRCGGCGCSTIMPASKAPPGVQTESCLPQHLITSPYDPEARYSRKKSTAWTGYKVHFTETCEADTRISLWRSSPPAPRWLMETSLGSCMRTWMSSRCFQLSI